MDCLISAGFGAEVDDVVDCLISAGFGAEVDDGDGVLDASSSSGSVTNVCAISLESSCLTVSRSSLLGFFGVPSSLTVGFPLSSTGIAFSKTTYCVSAFMLVNVPKSTTAVPLPLSPMVSTTEAGFTLDTGAGWPSSIFIKVPTNLYFVPGFMPW